MRVAAIEAAKFTHDGNPRKTFWTALATGTAMDGTFGVVRVRDQHGEEGFIIQQYAGASAGMTLSGDCAPDGYVEAAA
jgi:hypothetical protein